MKASIAIHVETLWTNRAELTLEQRKHALETSGRPGWMIATSAVTALARPVPRSAAMKPTNATLKQTNGGGIRWSKTFACSAKGRPELASSRNGSRSTTAVWSDPRSCHSRVDGIAAGTAPRAGAEAGAAARSVRVDRAAEAVHHGPRWHGALIRVTSEPAIAEPSRRRREGRQLPEELEGLKAISSERRRRAPCVRTEAPPRWHV